MIPFQGSLIQFFLRSEWIYINDEVSHLFDRVIFASVDEALRFFWCPFAECDDQIQYDNIELLIRFTLRQLHAKLGL